MASIWASGQSSLIVSFCAAAKCKAPFCIRFHERRARLAHQLNNNTRRAPPHVVLFFGEINGKRFHSERVFSIREWEMRRWSWFIACAAKEPHQRDYISKSNQSTDTRIAFYLGKELPWLRLQNLKVLMAQREIHLHSFVSSLCFTSCNKRHSGLFECCRKVKPFLLRKIHVFLNALQLNFWLFYLASLSRIAFQW